MNHYLYLYFVIFVYKLIFSYTIIKRKGICSYWYPIHRTTFKGVYNSLTRIRMIRAIKSSISN